ncbi:hypothetical protein AGLY_006938 [Aphis glycines]|uniref:Uncharacterized protein n=1 Tax=Aphis glycines TaxID=307491 RepID=A0A6G0TRB2_APHGL|nr:hypothetical protein AGLY_006938 [Aphis glycines]
MLLYFSLKSKRKCIKSKERVETIGFIYEYRFTRTKLMYLRDIHTSKYNKKLILQKYNINKRQNNQTPIIIISSLTSNRVCILNEFLKCNSHLFSNPIQERYNREVIFQHEILMRIILFCDITYSLNTLRKFQNLYDHNSSALIITVTAHSYLCKAVIRYELVSQGGQTVVLWPEQQETDQHLLTYTCEEFSVWCHLDFFRTKSRYSLRLSFKLNLATRYADINDNISKDKLLIFYSKMPYSKMFLEDINKTNNDCLAASMILVPDKSFDTPNDLVKKKNQKLIARIISEYLQHFALSNYC